jgi:hypothetical protein
MRRPNFLLASFAAVALALAAPSGKTAAAALRTELKRTPTLRGTALKPWPAAEAKHSMAPFQAGQCGV